MAAIVNVNTPKPSDNIHRNLSIHADSMPAATNRRSTNGDPMMHRPSKRGVMGISFSTPSDWPTMFRNITTATLSFAAKKV